jgi:succinate dehydrogenase/fumarate reductase-like Fe-S protein
VANKAETEIDKLALEALCPKCGVAIEGHKCRLCGATKSISDVSGNVVWMINGRVLAAFKDSRDAYVEMAKRHGIPESEWPDKFKSEETAT